MRCATRRGYFEVTQRSDYDDVFLEVVTFNCDLRMDLLKYFSLYLKSFVTLLWWVEYHNILKLSQKLGHVYFRDTTRLILLILWYFRYYDQEWLACKYIENFEATPNRVVTLTEKSENEDNINIFSPIACPKLSVLCRMGRKTLINQSINQSTYNYQ